MTSFLINYFIKDGDVKNSKTREKYGILTSVVGVLANIFLFATKLVIGILLNSIAIIADSFNNLSDSLISIVSFVGIKLGNRPADSEHPFGHGRLEYISTLVIAVSILALGFEFLRSSIYSILNPEAIGFDIISVSMLLLAVIIKIWLVSFYKKIGNIIDSKAMIATAKDSENDIIITVTTIISILVTTVTGFIIDGYIGVVVSYLLMRSGYEIAKDAISKIMGESIDTELAKGIKNIAESHDDIIGTHDLIIHNYGPSSNMATMHVDVCNKICINSAHTTIDKIEREVQRKFGVNLVIHIDPIPVDDERIKEIKSKVFEYINITDKNLDAHDFKIIEKADVMDVIFELVIPYEYNKDKKNEVLSKLSDIVKSLNVKYNCIIEPEYRYIRE